MKSKLIIVKVTIERSKGSTVTLQAQPVRLEQKSNGEIHLCKYQHDVDLSPVGSAIGGAIFLL
ncbi:MAG: hypothetical protein GY943_30505 [Chloroflexi bacterium]|nr:hypothetical protein [Chloroflexota bacterium]